MKVLILCLFLIGCSTTVQVEKYESVDAELYKYDNEYEHKQISLQEFGQLVTEQFSLLESKKDLFEVMRLTGHPTEKVDWGNEWRKIQEKLDWVLLQSIPKATVQAERKRTDAETEQIIREWLRGE
jgi:hypothetical protein